MKKAENENSINICEFRNISSKYIKKTTKIETDAEKRDQLLEKHTHSLDKRIKICEFHYICFRDVTESNFARLEKIGSVFIDGHDTRVQYEAHSLGLLHCLHALIDSVPFGINLIVEKIDDCSKIYLNEAFAKKYMDFSVKDNIQKILDDEDFCKLKSMINLSKHRHIIRIANTESGLVFEDFVYQHKKIQKESKSEPVLDFIEHSFNTLVPKVFKLYNDFMKDIKSAL